MAEFQSKSEGVEKIRGLLGWAKESTRGYANVNVTNMTSSWKDGLAFCAIIHRFRPDLINFKSLKAGDVLENNRLAFSVAEEELGIPALLDPEDMVEMAVPDRLCVITYVSQLHAHFKNCKPEEGERREAIGKNWRDKAAVANYLYQGRSYLNVGLKRPSAVPYIPPTKKRGTMEDICTICRKKVYIMERSLVEGKLYHRVCYKDSLATKKDPPKSGVDSIPETNGHSSNVPSTRITRKSSTASISGSSSSPSSSSTARASHSPSPSPRRTSRSPASKAAHSAPQDKPEARPRAAPRSTISAAASKEAMTQFLEDGNLGKKPPIPAARASITKMETPEERTMTSTMSMKGTSSTSLENVLSSSPPRSTSATSSSKSGSTSPLASAAFVGARINRLMAEKNNNFDFDATSKNEDDTEGSLAAQKRSKYLGLDDSDNEIDTATNKAVTPTTTATTTPTAATENGIKNLKPIPALRKIEQDHSISNISNTSADPSSTANSITTTRLSPSKVVTKGTLERKESGGSKDGVASTGKPTLFVKPMLKTQIAQHRRVYLAHFDVDGNVDVKTDDVEIDKSPTVTSQNELSKDAVSSARNRKDSSPTRPTSSLSLASASSINLEDTTAPSVRTKPYPSKRSSVITTTTTTTPTPISLATPDVSTATSSPSGSPSVVRSEKWTEKRTAGQLKIELPERKRVDEAKDKLSPSNPFYEGDDEETSVRKNDVTETKEGGIDVRSTREEDLLTPTNPFSDDFVDEDPMIDPLKTAREPAKEASSKAPPSKPPRILLQTDNSVPAAKRDEEEEDDDDKTPTKPPETPCKRVLSVDKSLLTDLKVPLYERDRDSRSVSGAEDRSKSSRNSSPSSLVGSECGASPVRRKTKRKAPPPPSEFQARLIRSASVTVALDTIEKELQEIDEEQQILEEKGVELETKLRSEDAEEDESVMEAIWAEWFQLVNRKNELFRREMELYHTRRMQELEDKHSEVERDIRILGNIPHDKKTPKDLEREEWLIKELIAIVNERNKVVDAVELDRQREKAEDESIEQMRERRLTLAANQHKTPEKKSKEDKKREKKEKKRLEKERKKEEKDVNKTASKGFALTFKRKPLAEKT